MTVIRNGMIIPSCSGMRAQFEKTNVRSNSLGLARTLANLLHDLVWCDQAAAYIEPHGPVRITLTPGPPPTALET